MLVKAGQKIHVIMRRQFETDVRRHFIGEVVESRNYAVLVEGYVFVFTQGLHQFVRKSDKRRRVTSLIDSRNVINLLPADTDVEQVAYVREGNQLFVTDGKEFKMDIHEFSH